MKRGFTLMEAVGTLAIVLLVLFMCLEILQQQHHLLKHGADKGSERDLGLLMTSLCRELAQADRVESPSGGVASSTLHFQFTDPHSDNLPTPVPVSPPTVWDPRPEELVWDARYVLSSGQLQREAHLLTQSASTPRPVLTRVDQFTVQRIASGLYRVTLRSEAVTITQSVALPCLQ